MPDEFPEIPNPAFLRSRFPGLARSPAVTHAAKRSDEKGISLHIKYPDFSPDDARIQNYLDRFNEIIESHDPMQRSRNINMLKLALIDHYIVRVEDIPDAYWQSHLRTLRERGQQADMQALSTDAQNKLKQEHLSRAKEDQKGSLEEWVDYMASDQSSYMPDYLKYWTFQGMLRLERYEKGSRELDTPGRFPERPTGRQRSVKMFPEVNHQGLKFISNAYRRAEKKAIDFRYDMPEAAKTQFIQYLEQKDFRSLYGWVQEYVPPISKEEMHITTGRWVVYKKDSEPEILNTSLIGKGSGWCIAGEQMAQHYLSSGDLHVYYTFDADGKPTVPRVVIVVRDDRVTEVRGIEWEENVDEYIQQTDIITGKLRELPGGNQFTQTDHDMKQLTAIDKKISAGELLMPVELRFLYEIERSIKYFGYREDPRIAGLRGKRNLEEDMPVLFNCSKDQIARNIGDIRADTKAYIGKLSPEVVKRLPPGIDYVFASFPGEQNRIGYLTIGGRTKEELIALVEATNRVKGIVNEGIKMMMENMDFTTLWSSQQIKTIRLKIENEFYTRPDLPGHPGYPDYNVYPTMAEIEKLAQKMGLKLCPPETAVNWWISDRDPMDTKSKNENLFFGMLPIVRGEKRLIFYFKRVNFSTLKYVFLSEDLTRDDLVRTMPELKCGLLYFGEDEIVLRLPTQVEREN